MADDRAQEIARLETEIAALQQTLAIFATNSALQEQIAAQLNEHQRQLTLMQSGGVNLGVDAISRDKIQIEQVIQIVQQIALGEAAPALLEQIRRLIGPQPGLQWDLYQAVAAGLGRANVAVTVDAQGALQVVDEPAPNHPPLDVRHFYELLRDLRRSILPPDGTLAPEELSARAMRYRLLIVEQFQYLRLEGLSTSTRPIVLPLEDVYVHLRAVAALPEAADAFTPEERRLLKLLEEQRAGDRINEATLREAQLRLDAIRRERWTRERLERFPIARALGDPEQRGLVILGDPGSGKSTLLQFLALSFAEGPDVAVARLQVNGTDADRLPIFVPLAAYDDMLNEQPALTVREFLPRYYDRRRAAPGLAPVFEQALAEGRALVLLDGLDEVIDERRRAFVAEQTTRFVQTTLAAGNRVVVTSRVYGYRVAPLATDLPHITVLDFGTEEIATFARQWFRALNRWEGGGSLSPQAELDAQAEERQLLEEIGRNPGVERLAVNPLLLTMLALLRRQVGALPQRRIKLYDLYISALIESWEEQRSRGARLHGYATRVDPTEAEGALLELALWLQEHRPSGTATHNELLELLTVFYLWEEQGLRVNSDRILPPLRRKSAQRAGQFLHDMRHYSGLLIELGQGAFGFRHLTFQEYFAGRALARMLADERWHRVEPNLHSGRWREPLLLCAARLGITENRAAEATALVTQVLEAGSEYEAQLHRDLFLAADCAADDIGLSLPLLRRIADALWPLLESPVPKVRHAALERLHGLALLRAGAQARLPEVQRRLVDMLLGWRVARAPLQEDYWQHMQALELLRRLPLEADPELRTTLLDYLTHPDLQLAMIHMLGRLVGNHEEVRDALLNCLADPQISIRLASIEALAKWGLSNTSLRTILLNCLTDPEPDIRATTIQQLGGLAGKSIELYTALFACLDDQDAGVRSVAVEALGGMLDTKTEILNALLKCIEDKDPDVRTNSIEALEGLVGSDNQVYISVFNCLDDEDPYVRCAAVEALGKLASIDLDIQKALIERTFDENPEVRAATITPLANLVESNTEVYIAIINLLDDEEEPIREASIEALSNLAEDDPYIRDALLSCIADDDLDVRYAAAKCIGKLSKDHTEVIEILIDYLESENTHLRYTVVQLLGCFAEINTEALKSLINCLNDESEDIWKESAVILGSLSNKNADMRSFLLERLTNPDEDIQAAAVVGLAGLVTSNTEIRNALFQSEAHVDWHTRRYLLLQAKEVLSTSQHGLFLPQLVDNLNCQEADTAAITTLSLLAPFVTQDATFRGAMLECLSNPWLTVRLVALQTLEDLAGNDAEVRAALIGCLTDAHPEMRRQAVEALHNLVESTADVRTTLLSRLADQDDDVRLAVVEALGGLAESSTQIRDALLDCLQDTAPQIRTAALVALRQLAGGNTQVRKALLHCLDDDDVNVRAIAVKAVSPLATNDTMVREALLDRLNDEERYVRDDVIEALRRLVGSSVELREALLDRLRYPAWHVRAAAVDTLGTLVENDAEVRSGLLGRLDDPAGPVRTAAVTAMGGTLAGSDAEVRAALLTCFQDPDRRVRAAAVTAVNELAESSVDVCEALLKRLDDEHSHIRAAAVAAVQGLAESNTTVRGILLEHLSDDDAHIRRAVMTALAGLAGNDAAVQTALLGRLDDDELHIQVAAITTLAGLVTSSSNIRTALLGCLTNPLPNVCIAALRALESLAATDPEVRAALLDRLGDPYPTIRDATVQALKGLVRDSPEVYNALLAQLPCPLPDVRVAAIQALSSLADSDPQVRAALLVLVADNDSKVRTAVVEALATLAKSHPEVRTALLQRLDDPQPNVRAAAIAVLVEQEENNAEQREALLERLTDSEPFIRLAAISLQPSLTSDPSWTSRLMPIIVWEPPLRSSVEVHRTLRNPAFLHAVQGRLAAQYATQLRTDLQLRAAITAQLSSEDWRLRAAAAAILAAAGKDTLREALPQLLAALDDRRGLESYPARLEAAALLLNNDTYGEEALACTLQALTYDAEAIFPADGAAEMRKQAALTLGRLKALHHRRDVAARIAALLGSERDPQVLDGLYDALSSLAAAPEAG